MGGIFIFLASILLALSTVLAHHITQGVNPIVIVFYSFSIAFIFFNIIGLKNQTFFNLIIKNLKFVMFVNISTAIDWLLIFIALKYINAALINCFVFGVAPIATLILDFKSYNTKIKIIQDTAVCVLISILLFALSIIYYQNNNMNITADHIKLGILLSCISGMATGATVYGCKKLQNCGFNTNSVMRSRFVVIIFIALIWIIYKNIDISLSFSAMNNIVLLSFIFIILPTFFLQKGIELTIPVSAAIITSLIPALTYVFQMFEPNSVFELKEMITITILSSVVFIATISKNIKG